MIILLIFAGGLSSVMATELNSFKVNVIESNSQAIVVDIKIDSLAAIQREINQQWFTELSINGCAYTDAVGLPRLPITSVVLGIHPDGKPKVSVINAEQVTRSLGKVLPVESPQTDDRDGSAEYEMNNPVNMPAGWYPASPASLGEIGYIRNQRIAQIEIHPVQYHTQTQMTRITQNLRLQITFEDADENAIASLASPKSIKESAVFETFFQNHLANYEQAKMWRRAPAKSNRLEKSSTFTFDEAYKLSVDREGIFVVTGSELAEAGANLSAIDIRTLKLSNKGNLVPFLLEGEGDGVFDENDRIIFIGEPNGESDRYFSPYTHTNVYLLSWGGAPGLHFAEISGYPNSDSLDVADIMKTIIHLEKDDEYGKLISCPDETVDHWFWQPMGLGGEYRFDLPVSLPIEDGYVTLRVAMHGLTNPAPSPDHHVVVKLNAIKRGDVIWDNQNATVFEDLQVPASLLNKDTNVLSFELPGDLGVDTDIVFLNWIELEYYRVFVAQLDTLKFQYPHYHRGVTKLTKIWGLTDPNVYIFDSTGRRIIDFSVNRVEDSFTVTFSNLAVGDETYFVAAASRLRHVNDIEKFVSENLKSTNNGADYIVITHADFMEQALRLAQLRTSQGLRTLVVDVQSVYNEFGYGIYDPRAIQRFLEYAYANWQSPAPQYILLFGDTSRNYDKLVWDEDINGRRKYPTFVPSMMLYTISWGMCSSDNYFVCVNGNDLLPDMHIGRLPANSEKEARNMVDKIISYESQPFLGEWKNNICLATGNGEFFEYSAQYLYDHFVPQRVKVSRIATNANSPFFGSTEELADIFNDGIVLLNFIGHGGGSVFDDSELFLLEDINRLSNKDKYPVVLSLTCFIGHFDNPEGPSLGEELLRADSRGAVGHFGSTGKAWLYGDYFLNNALFDEVFIKNHRSLGEITTFAKLNMIAQAQAYWDHVKNYVLLGDPATQIALANEIVDLQIPQRSLTSGDILSVNGLVKHANNGSVILSIFNEKESLITTKQVTFSNGKFSTALLTLDEQYLSSWEQNGGKGMVRAYYSDGQSDGIGGAVFYVLKPAISAVQVEPEDPMHNQEIYISAHIELSPQLAAQGVGEVRCLWSLNNASWNTIAMEIVAGNVYRTRESIQQPGPRDLFYKIQVIDTDGKTMLAETPSYSVRIRSKSNLFSRPEYARIGGTEEVEVRVKVANLGETDAGPFNIRLLDMDLEPEGEEVGAPAQVQGLPAQKDTIIAILWPGNPAGYHKINIRIDADNQVDETTELDNSFIVEFDIICKASGTAGEIFSADGAATLSVESNGVDRNSTIAWRTVTGGAYEEAITDFNCSKVKMTNDSRWGVYEMSTADSNLVFTKPFRVRFYWDQYDAVTLQLAEQGFLKVFAWKSNLSGWVSMQTEVDKENGYATAQVSSEMRIFTLLASQDADAPEITVSFEGQHFANGDYVGQTPNIAVVIEDASGLDITQESISLELNDQKLTREDYAMFQNEGISKRVTCTYSPLLESGDYTLKVAATDIHGNFDTKEITFSISGDFTLAGIANHPNPFVDVTIIAFHLTDKAETVDIDIFSSSGRKIWSAQLIDVAGYHELDWDGTDMNGDEVANGVYYMKFSAQRGDEKIARIEKLAKLK